MTYLILMLRTITICHERGVTQTKVYLLICFIEYFWKDTQTAVSSGLLQVGDLEGKKTSQLCHEKEVIQCLAFCTLCVSAP